MNERIQELLLKAGFTNAYTDPQDGFELVFVDEDHTTQSVEKFAELIIKECASALEKKIDEGDGYGAYENGAYHGLIRARNIIKKHFGVE